MSRIVRLDGTAMVYRTGLVPPHEVFVRERGWVAVDDLQVGDMISRGTTPPRYQRVSAIEDE